MMTVDTHSEDATDSCSYERGATMTRYGAIARGRVTTRRRVLPRIMVWGIALGIALGVALDVALGGALSKRHGDALFGARMMRARNESRPALGLSYGEMIPLGRRIALHCSSHNNLLNMHPNDGCHVSRSDGRNYNDVPIPNTGDWRYTLFYVQDAGNGKIRLFNPYHGKYVAAPTSSQGDSPLRCTTSASSQYAQWQVQDAGDGKISLYNTARGKYLGVGRKSASMASGKGSDEKLRVVPAPDSAQINEDKTASVAVGCSDVTLCDVKDYIVSLGNEISGYFRNSAGNLVDRSGNAISNSATGVWNTVNNAGGSTWKWLTGRRLLAHDPVTSVETSVAHLGASNCADLAFQCMYREYKKKYDEAASDLTAVQGWRTLSNVKGSGLVHSTLKTAIGTAQTAVSDIDKVKGWKTLSNVKDSGLVHSTLKTAIGTAQTAVSDIAKVKGWTTLSNVKGSGLVSSAFEAAVDTAIDVVAKSTTVVEQVPAKISDAVEKLASLCSYVDTGLDTLTDTIFKNMFPLDPSVIVDSFNDAVSQVLSSSSATAALGAAPLRDLFHADNEDALRAHIRAALRGEEVSDAYADIPRSFDNEFSHASDRAELGSSEGFCVEFVTVSSQNNVEEGYAADMPWPEKLADDPRSPNSYTIKFPTITTKACLRGGSSANLGGFSSEDALDGVGEMIRIPTSLAERLIEGFQTYFKQIFTDGIQAVVDGCEEIETQIKTSTTFVTEKVDDLQDALNGRRRLLDEYVREESQPAKHREMLALLGEQKLDLMEEKLLRKIYELRRMIHEDPLLERYESPVVRPEPTSAVVETAALGSSFDNAMESAREFFTTVLQDGMTSGLDFKQTLSITKSIETSIEVSNGEFHEGDLLEHLADDNGDAPEAKVDADRLVPVFLPLMALVQFDGELRFPYFFQAVATGTLQISASVTFELTFGVEDGEVIMPTVSVRDVSYGTPGEVSLSSSLQVGAVFRLNNFFVGMCVGSSLCVGPRVTARQKVFVGFDMFAVGAQTTEGSCFSGKNTLETVFNDWDYADDVKNACRVSKTGYAFGAGAYYQVPKTQLEITIARLQDHGFVSSYTSVHNFGIQEHIGELEDNFAIGQLGHFCPRNLWHEGSQNITACPCVETCPDAPSTDPDAPSTDPDAPSTDPDAPSTIRGRYIKVLQTQNRYLNIAELVAWSDEDGTRRNVANGASVASDIGFKGKFTGDKLTNGIVDAANDFAFFAGKGAQFLVDLGEEKEIVGLALVNRVRNPDKTYNGQNRIVGVKVQLLDAQNDVVLETRVIETPDENVYVNMLVDGDTDASWTTFDSLSDVGPA